MMKGKPPMLPKGGKMSMAQAMKKYEGSKADMKADRAGAKKMMKKGKGY